MLTTQYLKPPEPGPRSVILAGAAIMPPFVYFVYFVVKPSPLCAFVVKSPPHPSPKPRKIRSMTFSLTPAMNCSTKGICSTRMTGR
jgi:hypothetical protein